VDAETHQTLTDLRDRRAAEAKARAAAGPPDHDHHGNPLPWGEPLVAVHLDHLRRLTQEARPLPGDGPAEAARLAALARGARAGGPPADRPEALAELQPGQLLLSIQLCDLTFLLDRVAVG